MRQHSDADADERSAALLAHANQKAIDQWVAETLNKVKWYAIGSDDDFSLYVRVEDLADAFGLAWSEFGKPGFKVKK